MEMIHLVGFAVAVVYAAFSQPFVGLALCNIAMLYLYLLNEHLLHPRMVELAAAVNTALPSREEFLRSSLRDLRAPTDDVCIVCRDEPTSPVQTPCGHIFCKDCFYEWIKRDNNRCPQCTRKLFEGSRVLEKRVKLGVAAMAFAVPVGTLNVLFAPANRFCVVLNSIGIFCQFLVLLKAAVCRNRVGTSWWKHLLPNDADNAREVLGEAEDVELVETLFGVPLFWAVWQATMLHQWIPDGQLRAILSLLYEVFCVW